MTTSQRTVIDAYLEALDPPDLCAARLVVTASLDAGMTVATAMQTILVPAQEEVGRRWQTNQWSVAQEAAATAVTDAVLAALSLRSPSPTSSGLQIVTGCVEGEWHTMPLRMLNETLAGDGHDVVFLGPSLPLAQLGGILREINPVDALVSCTNPINLPGARRTILVAHAAGVPVLIGGRALDEFGVRSRALGADGWATNAREATTILGEWQRDRPDLAKPTRLSPEQAELELPRRGVIDDCLFELMQTRSRFIKMPVAEMARTRAGITDILRFCSAALVTSDPRVLDESTGWLRDFLAPRGVTSVTVATMYRAISTVLGHGFPETRAILAASVALL